MNHLYDRHGSINLFLHEHAHSLDAVYYPQGISSSKEWLNLVKENPSIRVYSDRVCGDYCKDNEMERFAELFARYHDGAKTRQQMELEVPALANFYKNLKTVDDLKRIHQR